MIVLVVLRNGLPKMMGVAGSKPWQACCLSRCQSMRSLVAQVDSETQKSRKENATVYLGLGQFGPYV
jgi:hypothetical protein